MFDSLLYDLLSS